MLHSFVYNVAFTKDLQDAFRDRDASVFEAEIIRLCGIVASKSPSQFETNNYEEDLTRLTLCLGLLDAIERQGETLGFLCDLINF